MEKFMIVYTHGDEPINACIIHAKTPLLAMLEWCRENPQFRYLGRSDEPLKDDSELDERLKSWKKLFNNF